MWKKVSVTNHTQSSAEYDWRNVKTDTVPEVLSLGDIWVLAYSVSEGNTSIIGGIGISIRLRRYEYWVSQYQTKQVFVWVTDWQITTVTRTVTLTLTVHYSLNQSPVVLLTSNWVSDGHTTQSHWRLSNTNWHLLSDSQSLLTHWQWQWEWIMKWWMVNSESVTVTHCHRISY